MAQTLIHLDTSFLILALRSGSTQAAELERWMANSESLRISSVAWAEFLCGPREQRQLELAVAVLGEPEPFLGQDSAVAADLFNTSGRRRGTVIDCMIAAVAIRLDASLATANQADFRRFANLRLAARR